VLAQHVADVHANAGTGARVAWVELAGLTEPAYVVGAIAGTIGVTTGSADPLRALVKALTPFEMLIALDNAEHLVDALAGVAQALVEGTQGVRVLVTSQVPLKVGAERVYRLGALSVPQAQVTSSEALAHGAVALFVERVHAIDQRFALEERNVEALVDVCRQLDGLPLAIELAAARVPVLGLQGVRERLGERLRLLNSGVRTAPPRHQTLRAALEWSYSLLGGDEQVVFQRLGVFAGGFSLAMAEQVVGDHRLDPWAVIDALGALVDRSLVAVDGADPPRYRLLESARALAQERLAIAGEHEELRRRHAQAVRGLFTRVQDDALRYGTMGVDLARAVLVADIDNAREAFGWALQHDAETAVALISPLKMAMRRIGPAEMLRAIKATEALVTEVSASVRVIWELAAVTFWGFRNRERSTESARRVVALCRELGDGLLLYAALACLGRCDASLSGDERRQLLEEMRALEQVDWPPNAACLRRSAEFFMEISGPCPSFEAAIDLMRQNSVSNRQMGDSLAATGSLQHVAWAELQAARLDDSIRHGLELLEQNAGDPRHGLTMALVRKNLVAAWVQKGGLEEARAHARAAWPQVVLFEIFIDHLADSLALLAALEGRMHTATRLRGYAEAVRERFRSARWAAEIQIADEADRLARERLGNTEFERLREEGARLRDDEIPALAFAMEDSA
jgi:predicted ATPase